MLKYLVFTILMNGFIACGSDSNSQSEKSKDTIAKKKPLSHHDTAMLMIGDTHSYRLFFAWGER